jgi:hypothetical protein
MKTAAKLVLIAGFFAVSAVRCEGGAEPICDAAQLTAALEAAQPGDTVRVGACRVQGSFTVPAGVSLVGSGADASTLVTDSAKPGVWVTPGTPTTRLADLAIESNANYGVFIRGDGGATVERVVVRSNRAVALGADDVDSLALADVDLQGPVTPANQLVYGFDPQPESAPTHGLLLVRVASADLTDVTATGFAQFGALLVESTTTWRGGGTPRNMGNGMMVHAGTAHLEDLDLSGTFGDFRVFPDYGAVFAAEAVVDTTDLVVSGGVNFGLLHDHATVTHVGLKASNNVHAGVWVQNCHSFELTGEGTELLDNGIGGVVAVDTPVVTLADAAIARTRIVRRVYGETSTRDVGAGIEMVRVGDGSTLDGVTLRNLTLTNNKQVGLFIQLGPGATTDGLAVEGITIERNLDVDPELADAYGAAVQGDSVPGDWDHGEVERDADTAARDDARRASLDRVGALDSTEYPGADDVAREGPVGIVDPQPPG